MSAKWDVNDWIDEISSMPIKRFYPTAVAKDTKLPIDEAYEYLMDAVDSRKLNLLWEIRCPNLECIRALSISPEKITSGEISCPICGMEIIIAPDIVYPVFEISPEYKARIKQKKTQKHRIAFAMSRI